uniref:hypothetical protein n=1 Tax=Actinokineospora sp. CA-119265 TaxID=3239890 RepID=UPI003F494804
MLPSLTSAERRALVGRLRRFADDGKFVSAFGGEALDLLCVAVADDRAGQPRRDNVTGDDIHGGLGLIAAERERLDAVEVSLIEAALDRGESLPELARLYDISRQALTKRYYSLGGVRAPLTGHADEVTPLGTVVRYWMARTEAGVHGDDAVEVTLHHDGINHRPQPPASISGDPDGGAYVGDLPRPGTTISGRVYPMGDRTNRIDVWLRAEASPSAEA